jgi:hypothetical protein
LQEPTGVSLAGRKLPFLEDLAFPSPRELDCVILNKMQISETQGSPLSDPPASDFEMAAPMKQSNSRASTPTGLFRIPQSIQTPTTPQDPQIPGERSTSVMGAERTPMRPASTIPTPMSRVPLDTVESMEAVESPAMVSSALATQGAPSQEVTQVCCQGKSSQLDTRKSLRRVSIANLSSRIPGYFRDFCHSVFRHCTQHSGDLLPRPRAW